MTALGAGEQGYRDALDVIANGTITTQAVVPFVNHSDPDVPDDRGEWLPDLPILNDTPGTDDNQYVTYSRTTITVPGPGDYTFRVRSDDGGALRIQGATFTSLVSGQPWQIDPLDPSTIFHPIYGGNREVTAVANFPAAGDYLVEYFVFEGGGGSFQEVSWAPGAFTALNQTMEWELVGDHSQFTPNIESKWGAIPENLLPALPTDQAGWSAHLWYGATGGSLAATTNFIRGATPPTVEVVLDELDHSDDGGNIGAQLDPSADPFPGDPNPGGDTNDIKMIARARIVAPVDGVYTIQVHSDDGFLFRWLDTDNVFTSKDGGGNVHPNYPSEAYFPTGTGDSNTRAAVFLTAGEHEAIFVWWEGVGGSHFEVSAAPGEILTNNAPEFEILSTTQSAANLYVTSAAGNPVRIVDVILDEGAGTVTIVFTSTEGRTYTIEYTKDLATRIEIVDGYPADPGDTTSFTWSGDGFGDPATDDNLFFFVTQNPPATP